MDLYQHFDLLFYDTPLSSQAGAPEFVLSVNIQCFASRQTATALSFSLFVFLSCLGGANGMAYLVAYKEGFLSTNPLKNSRECICNCSLAWVFFFSFLFFFFSPVLIIGFF